MKTDVQDEAGKHATFDDTFQLPNVAALVRDNSSLVFEAYDKDLMSSDLLGATDPLDYVEMVQDE